MEDSCLLGNNKIITYKDGNVLMKLSIPLLYPEKFCATILNLSFHSTDNTVSNDSKVLISNELDLILSGNNGEEVLFDAINYLRERVSVEELSGTREQRRETEDDLESTGYIDECVPRNGEKNASTSDSEYSSSNVQNYAPSQSIRVYHGEVTVEKKSQFLSHFAFVSSIEEVNEFRQIILADKKCSRATHNIFAFRFLCPRTGGQYCLV
jgi:Uncharacterized protein family UPF0029